MKLALKKVDKKVRVFASLLMLICSCQSSNKSSGGWQLVFQNDENGQTIFGDKSKLIDAVRLGHPVRIGWGGNRVEHIANVDFLTILQGEEVFAQTNTIIGQTPQIKGDSLKIRFRNQNHWTKISGTNGYSTGLMTDYFQDSLVGGGTDRYSSTTWYILYPNNQLEQKARPLWRKESPNWGTWRKKNE